ncbi:MAG TPA: dephospho-CoA kinase [Candidatus Angelobacter sp.]|nr:dephospho-CoA kinase [Candidatus Angelobacter sp.]
MLRAGLTGGMACGKSAVAAMFGELGAHVLQADTLAHKLYQPGEPVYQEVVKRFGQEIVQEDGAIDRKRLAALAFDGGRVEELNRIVHPVVLRRQEQWMFDVRQKEPHAVVIVEAALIFEAGAARQFDKIIVVTCRQEQKIARLAQRGGISEEEARAEMERRSKTQLPDDEKIRRASYVIDNSGSLDLTRNQVQRVFWELKTLALRSH